MKRLIFGLILLIAGTALSQTTQQKIASVQAQTPAATQTPVKSKTSSLNSANPNYAKEQKKYDGPDRDFSAQPTKKSTRKDTTKRKKS